MTKVKTLLLTRPEAQSRGLAKDIETHFPEARCLISPLIEIQLIGSLPDLSGIAALIFTSVNGVQAYGNLGGPIGMRSYCVGNKTAQAAREIDLEAVSADGASANLISLIASEVAPTGGDLLHIRGEHTTGDIAQILTAKGFGVREAKLYRQSTVALSEAAKSALAFSSVAVIPIYSPRTAELLAAEFTANPDWPRDQITVVCIGQNAAAALSGLGFGKIAIADAPNGAAMLAAIAKVLRQKSLI